jgi:hypothetical protein
VTQRSVEQVIGRLATDEEFRHQFLHSPAVALARVAREGLELNPCELRALTALDGGSLERFAESIDARLQKAWLARPDRRRTSGTSRIGVEEAPAPPAPDREEATR